MIISREFVPFRTLIESCDKGGELFVEICKKTYPEEQWGCALLRLSGFSLYQRDMSWGFRGIGELIDGFCKLDESDPYETGYDLNDARTADILWCDEGSMTLLLRAGDNEGKAIVGMVEVDSTVK